MIVFTPIPFYDLLSFILSVLVFFVFLVTLILTMRQVGLTSRQLSEMSNQTAAMSRQTAHMGEQTQSFVGSYKSGTYQSVIGQLLSVDMIFLDYPEIRPYFYGNETIDSTHAHYNRALAIAEYILDYYQGYLLQAEEFPQVWTPETFELYVVNAFSNSPILCSYLESLQDFYHSRLWDLMQVGKKRGVQIQVAQVFDNPVTSIHEP